LIICMFFDFASLAWKRLFTPPKLFFGGIWLTKWEQYQQNSQKAHPWAQRRHMRYRSSKSVHRCDLCAWGRDQKGKKDNCVFAETTHVVGSTWNFAWLVVFRGRCMVRISSKSVKWFRSCEGRNLLIPIDLAIGLYNSLYYRTSRDLQWIK